MLQARCTGSRWWVTALSLFACAPAWPQAMTILEVSRQIAYDVELPDCTSSTHQLDGQSDCIDLAAHGGCETDFGDITGYCDQRTSITPTRIAGWGFADVNASQLPAES